MKQAYDQVPVRDALAAERTVLAAERTFLAYLRSSFALFVTGVTGAQFLEAPALLYIAHALSASSVFVFLFGVQRYLGSRRTVRALLERISAEEDATPGG